MKSSFPLMLQTEIKAEFKLQKPEGEELSPEEREYLDDMNTAVNLICEQLHSTVYNLTIVMMQNIQKL